MAVGGTPFEVQAMVVTLSSACASNGDRSSAEIGRYFVAPLWFVDGAEIAVIGNVAIGTVFVLLHSLLASLVVSYSKRHGSGADGMAAVWFPGLSMWVCTVLYLGVAVYWVQLVWAWVPSGGGVALWGAAAGSGFLYLSAVPAAYLFCMWSGRDAVFNATDLSKVGPVETMAVRSCGRWAPEWHQGRLGMCTAMYRSRLAQGGQFMYVLSLCFATPLGMVSGQMGCLISCVALGCMCVVCGVVILAVRPHAIIGQNWLSGVCMILLGAMMVVEGYWMWSPSEELVTTKSVLCVSVAVVAALRAIQWVASRLYEWRLVTASSRREELFDLPSVASGLEWVGGTGGPPTTDTVDLHRPNEACFQVYDDDGVVMLGGSSVRLDSFASARYSPKSPGGGGVSLSDMACGLMAVHQAITCFVVPRWSP